MGRGAEKPPFLINEKRAHFRMPTFTVVCSDKHLKELLLVDDVSEQSDDNYVVYVVTT
jgi:hypothetical protein